LSTNRADKGDDCEIEKRKNRMKTFLRNCLTEFNVPGFKDKRKWSIESRKELWSHTVLIEGRTVITEEGEVQGHNK